MKNIFKGIVIAGAMLSAVSCQEFLNRPTEDNYSTASFYQTDEQVLQGINYLYNSPWYDFQRGFIKVGEVMSGNMYWGGSPYLSLTANGTDTDLKNMSYSLWAVNGHANTVIKNIIEAQGSTASQAVKNQAIGEALTLKALAYFFLVRSFGEVPIIHENAALLGGGDYNSVPKLKRECIYEYIIMTLEKAMELLPKNPYIGQYNRVDYYAAEALLAKTYLTRAGLSGSLNADDLAMAAKYAKDVIDNSGRTLSPRYSDIFRLDPKTFNATGEPLISWHWTINGGQWTRQNTLQSDLMFEGFSENGDLWGGWGGPSVDLADAFGVSVLDDPLLTRVDSKGNNIELDKRRQCSMMMPGDHYEYFWTDRTDPIYGRTGFNYIAGLFATSPQDGESKAYADGGPGQMECATGTNCVKHLYGDNADHAAAIGQPAANMAYQLPTHILRLGDIYLVYAEAVCDSDNAAAAAAVNTIRKRAYGVFSGELSEADFNSKYAVSSVTREQIWKERRLELSGEGDYWYDFVRRSYFQADKVIAEIKAQRRSTYNALGDIYKKYWESGMTKFEYNPNEVFYGNGNKDLIDPNDPSKGHIGNEDNPNVTISSFTLPFPTEDVVFNGKVASDAEAETVDVREVYQYNF